MATLAKLSHFDGVTFEDACLYCSLVGSLPYMSVTHPNISFVVNRIYQFIHSPKILHWQAVKCILHYFKRISHFGLYLTTNTHLTLSTFFDADWAECLDDRKFTVNFCVYLNSYLVSWSSKKQPTIARYFTEAEYKANANGTCEII